MSRASRSARRPCRRFLCKPEPFVWNATNLSRQMRSKVLGFAHAYGVRTVILYVKGPEDFVRGRNRERHRSVPDAVIDRMLHEWKVPTPPEAH
ncbi:AAA family ATPase [Rhodospirillaceae bacterium SYSU D60014]|uniref:AAA family ATPase n=1 Tax=Virgifigura deserti TaxID=2268457 RepID=UPI0013C4A5FC